jgi:hydrogenase expression/formation protein HypE
MKTKDTVVLLSHGSGGRLMNELIRELFLKNLGNPILDRLTDAAELELDSKSAVFTTDSFVVKPLFFPKADIGKLAVAGTVNDLLMLGGKPKYLSLSLIIQENFPLILLEKIIKSITKACDKAGVKIVTGDTKVVDRNSCDGIFINTSGIGMKLPGTELGFRRIKDGDAIIINGQIASHGVSIISARENLKFDIASDCESLESLIIPLLKEFKRDIHFLRDPTRGGLATTLNEIAQEIRYSVIIDEKSVPVSKEVLYACEILGFDPLYMANEGKAVIVADETISKDAIKYLRRDKLGKNAAIIGKITKGFGKKVIAKTAIGSLRIIDMHEGDPLPRIC